MFAALASPSTSNTLAVDVADAQALKAKALSGDREALVGAARQFESMLVSQMLKTMRQAPLSGEDDPMSSGEGFKLYRDLLDQQWATQLSKGRGLGFADMMVKALERQSTAMPPLAMGEGRGEGDGKGSAGPAQTTPVSCALGTCPPADKPSAAPQAPLPVGRGDPADPKRDFIDRMRPHAEAAAAATGVPAHFILGQAALESGWGRREIKDANGVPSHNLFGIKAGSTWDGAVAETLTTEYRQGVPMKMTQHFRAYSDYSSAFTDYANLLKSRYASALQGGANVETFAKGLANGGYATDPAYASKLQAVIAKVAMAGV
jgi:peptidoglycan hydrolase FlgJ